MDQKILPVSQQLIFRGHYELRVLRGSITLAGLTIPTGSDWIPVSCPNPPYYTIKPQFSAGSTDLVPADFDAGDATCVIEIRSKPLDYIGALAPPFKSLFEPIQQLSCATDSAQLWNLFSTWSQININSNDRIVLVGPKNSGKSSLVRYLSNRYGPVYVLDLDPGQCEFTPPGSLSLVKCDSINLAATYLRAATRSETIIDTQTFGYVSPMDTPGRYLDISKHLLTSYPGDAPLIVNTPGWTKGLGLELVREVIHIVNATKAIHMGHDESYEELQGSLLESLNLKMDVVEPVEVSQSKFSASDMRTLQTICYFHINNPAHITQWAPYELAFDSTDKTGSCISAVAVLDSENIDPVDYPICIEGTVVAINQLTSSIPIDKGTIPFLSSETTASLAEYSTTIGYAVVQKFTPFGVRFLTPVDPELISGPIILVRGRLGIPTYLLWDQETQQAPWLVSKNPPGVGSVYTKFRRNIGRN